MSATLFLTVNGLIVLYLIFRISASRTAKPTPLKTTGEAFAARKEPEISGNAGKEKSLNCYFQFNGHMWDAFEVLGIPAGSNREACDRAMMDLRRSKASDQEFLSHCAEALAKYFTVS